MGGVWARILSVKDRQAAILFVSFMLLQSSVKAEEMFSYTNRLSREKSPYLLQHAHNPVDWYPWGEEAFEKARKEDKPIFLSVGYSTCHWCHVMEEESFSDVSVAEIMNKNFVPVKVDREERPDIDSVYMNYVTASTGSGGWPMNVFLTPDKKPFYGGTYFPPEDRYGMPGFGHLLSSLAESWKNQRQEITASADSAVTFLNKKSQETRNPSQLSAETLVEAFKRYEANVDDADGGFGGAPKFPRSHSLSFILRQFARTKNARALQITEKTLTAMARGGIYDQLGGGFHRYSTDARWRVPHFEKMLYDQAILARTYLEAYQVTHDEFYARIAREILEYVSDRMTSPEGGFYSAEDADSLDPENHVSANDPGASVPAGKKREGAYYVWRKSDLEKALPAAAAEIACYYYGVEPSGNALNDPHREFVGQNVLHVAHSIPEAASHFKKSEKEIIISLQESRQTLLGVRAKRPAPYLDDKLLTDWNGLMISAYAFGATVLDEPRYAEKAKRAAEFIRSKLKDAQGALWHRYRENTSGIEGHLNDYSFLIYGYLALYEATFEPTWLKEAKQLADGMIAVFWDTTDGGFFMTSGLAEKLITRPKELYDGALPSGNSIALLDLLLLSRFTGDKQYEALAQKALASFSSEVTAEPANYPQLLIALDFSIGPSQEIVMAAVPGDTTVAAMRREIYSRFIPNKIVLFHEDGQAGKSLETVSPFVKDKKPVKGKTAVYVCRHQACQLPVTDLEELKKSLNASTEK